MTLESGFTLGDWTVYPLEGRLVGEQGEQRLQPKTMDVLLCLAEAGDAVVQREDMLRRVWGERAQSDEPLTRCIGELRRALGDTRADSAYILTIPKRGYRLLKDAVPLVTADTAEDEASPSGKPYTIHLTQPQKKIRSGTIKKITIAIIVLLAAAMLEVVFERALEDAEFQIAGHESSDSEVDEGPARGGKSIVVLPLINMSADEEQEYFSDGVTEELINLLTRVPDLRVISRTSAFSFKGKNLDLPTIASRLSVEHVLEGSVRMAGNEVRITVQLVDAHSDTHVWSETYERQLDDIFVTQEEIASRVVEQLKVSLLGDSPTIRTTDPDAYALVLKARYVGRQLTPDAVENSIALYKQVLAIDPGYAPAWNGLARAYMRRPDQTMQEVDQNFSLARDAATRALSLDPAHARAYDSLGWIAMEYDRDLEKAARYYEQALDPETVNNASYFNAAILASSLGRLDLAIRLAEYGAKHDPLSPIGNRNLALLYLFAGRLDEAITTFRHTLELNPGQIGGQSFIGLALLLKGEADSALAEIHKEADESWRLAALVMAFHVLGQSGESDEVLAELIDKYEEISPFNIASALAFRGEADRAFDWLDKAMAYSDAGITDIVVWPFLAEIRSDRRWLPLLKRIGMAPEQLAEIEFKVSLPVRADET